MKRNKIKSSAITHTERIPAEVEARAAAEAAAFLARHDQIQFAAAGSDGRVDFSLFPRTDVAAQKSTVAIMARVQALPTASKTSPALFAGRRTQGLVLALAAVLLVVASSALTARYMAGRQLATVTFVLYAPGAQTVAVSGDFNEWSTEVHILQPAGAEGRWELTLQLPRGQIYNYNFVIDGEEWIVDPESLLIQDDGMGGSVSSLLL
ncbi:MAG: isoamylase early set domain-containing protein [Spirochaetes bacterium]|nr:isoamylase early set domain-containing protein [Spirochaetota bacterium]MBU0955576.1 isoamylase early set domain-containing protein [Spirochaetota bacterium]